MDELDNRLEREHSLRVVLPGGLERNVSVPGSKPLMDVMVNLCASHHLNPSDYTMEVLSPNKNVIAFKPNSAVGLLEAEKIVLKPKGTEKNIKPYQPEVSVRLLINYNKAQKAVVRVNPKLPLEMLLPIVCEKCEFNVETSVLLKDSRSEVPLDLSKSLNDLGLRQVFAKDMDAKDPMDQQDKPAETQLRRKQKENSGFLSLFRRRKKELEVGQAASAPISPTLSRRTRVGSIGNGVTPSKTLPLDKPKKRRAPPPPMAASHSTPSNLGRCHVEDEQRSGESTLRSTKRRAPPPPCAAGPRQELQAEAHVTGTVESLEDPSESDGSQTSMPSLQPAQAQSSSSSPYCSTPSYLQEGTEKRLSSLRGRDQSDARTALAQVLMSSVSKSSLVKRLSHSATIAKFPNGSPCMSTSLKRSDDGDYCAELESVLDSNFPTENNLENPVERTGLTTFKVVPPKTASLSVSDNTPRSPEVSQSLEEDNPTAEALPEVKSLKKESKDELNSSDISGSETPLASSENFQDSPLDLHNSDSPPVNLPSALEETTEDQEKEEPEVSTEETITELARSIEKLSTEGDITGVDLHQNSTPDRDEQSFCLNKEATQEEKEDEEQANFPPPPPPVFFNEYTDVTIDASPPPSPALSKKSEPPEDKPSSHLPKRSTSLSRFAQAVTKAVQRSRLQNFRKGSNLQESVGAHQTTSNPYQYDARTRRKLNAKKKKNNSSKCGPTRTETTSLERRLLCRK
ncbi:protein cordon-bleu-like isoform X2 [Gouania willdenowi]|uniref:protein cordon-bleu-like isoform X2 n=1 Tax=Gouania willdenowi TaxID=441366 RepID=UPI001056D134|nr:protein cordon-bleu-like isoform X2 [Gouania willdenowi]